MIAPGSSYAEAYDAAIAWAEIEILPVVEEGITPYVSLPASVDASYAGYIGGEDSGGDGPAINYVANLSISVDFATGDADGMIDGFVTDYAGFEHPDGQIDVSGSVSDGAGDAIIGFSGSGELVGDTATAMYDTSSSGVFLGDDERAIGGDGASHFAWTSGDLDGLESSTSDLWGAALAE